MCCCSRRASPARPPNSPAWSPNAGAAGLLAADYGGELPSVFVHRWTAAELHRRLSREQRGEEVADAHRRAAEYWRWRISSWPHDRHALHEASYHLLRAGEGGQRDRAGARRGTARRPTVLGSAALAVTVAAGVTAAATGAFSAPSAPARPGGGARRRRRGPARQDGPRPCVARPRHGWPRRRAGMRSCPATRRCAPRCRRTGYRRGTFWYCARPRPIRSARTW